MGRIPTTVGVIPGAGLVARFGNVVIVLHGESPSTDRILGTAETAAGAADPGMAIAQRLAATVFAGSSAQPPAFGVVAPTAGGILILLRGPVTATVDGPEGHRVLSGERAMTWADEIIRDPVRGLTLSAGGATGETPHTDLRAGVVPGGGVVLHAPVSGLPPQRGGDSTPNAASAHTPAPESTPPHQRTPEHHHSATSGSAHQHPSGPVVTPGSGATPGPSATPGSSATGGSSAAGGVGASAPATQHASAHAAQHGSTPPTQLGSTPPSQHVPAPTRHSSSTPPPQHASAPHAEHPSTPPAQHASTPPTQHASGPPTPHRPEPGAGPDVDVTRRAPTPSRSQAGFFAAGASAGAEAGRVQPVSASAADSMPKAGPAHPRNAATTPRVGGPDTPRAGGPDLSKKPAAASKPAGRAEDRPDPEDQPPTAAYTPEVEVAETRVAGGPPSTSTLAGPGASLTSAEGETYPLDRPYVIGRDPMIDEAVRRAVASPIVIARDRHVSRVHARVFVEKGQVFVRDAGTPGGTYVAAPGAADWVRVGQQPMELKVGWSLRIGERILTYRTA
ncbi:FHA domain-containing protein [Nocardia sp. NPDC004582]